MRKLNILKTIVDWFWIISMLSVPLVIIMIGFVIVDDSNFGIPIRVNGILYEEFNANTKLILIASLISYLLSLYAIYLFKNVLREFQKTKVFSPKVSDSFYKMGIVLLISALLTGVPSFLYRILSRLKFELEFGLSPFLLLLCFGLFFMILSEVFKIGQRAKEENELTV